MGSVYIQTGANYKVHRHNNFGVTPTIESSTSKYHNHPNQQVSLNITDVFLAGLCGFVTEM